MIADKKRTVISLPLQKTAPSKYVISVSRKSFSGSSGIIIWEDFNNDLAKVFSLESKTMYNLLKNSITYGKTVSFGEYTKDVAETMVISAQCICKKYKPAILPIFETVKM